MVSTKSVEDQLKKLGFKKGWNGPECAELATVLLPDEEIFECVNGWYEGGLALLCATNVRVLLIDKKPFKYLNVEDVRFDTINQIDYFHRMFNASICISAGLRNLMFKSYSQPRLRKLISHVQHRMAELKKVEQAERAKNEGNLQEMDQQLRAYLMSRYEQHQSLRRQHEPGLPPMTATPVEAKVEAKPQEVSASTPVPIAADTTRQAVGATKAELYEDGVREIFGKYQSAGTTEPIKTAVTLSDPLQVDLEDETENKRLLKIAYSKLPQILSARK